jgi:hypothetical protein
LLGVTKGRGGSEKVGEGEDLEEEEGGVDFRGTSGTGMVAEGVRGTSFTLDWSFDSGGGGISFLLIG